MYNDKQIENASDWEIQNEIESIQYKSQHLKELMEYLNFVENKLKKILCKKANVALGINRKANKKKVA